MSFPFLTVLAGQLPCRDPDEHLVEPSRRKNGNEVTDDQSEDREQERHNSS